MAKRAKALGLSVDTDKTSLRSARSLYSLLETVCPCSALAKVVYREDTDTPCLFCMLQEVHGL